MEKLKIIHHMQATENGVIYYYPCATKACTATLENDGTIGMMFIPLFKQIIPNTFIQEEAIEEKFSYIKTLLFDCILIFIAIFWHNENLFLATTMFSLFISLRLFKLLHVIYEMKISKRLYQTSKFVAASHMATNAYRKLQRIPTLAEAKKCSKFSTDSKIGMTFARIFSHIAIMIFMLIFEEISPFGLFLMAIIIPVLSTLLATLGIFNFLQTFVTSKPSDKELEVAITGIRLYEKFEDAKVTFYKE